MPEPTAAEVVPKMIVREAIPAVPVTARDKMADQLGKRTDEVGWRKAAEEASKQKPIDKNKITQTFEQIGVERDATTGAKTRPGDEKIRYDAAKENADIAIDFAENGYDNMHPPTRQDALRNQVLLAAKLHPVSRAELNGLTPNQQVAWAEARLRNPNFAVVAKNLLLERGSPEKIKITDAINPAQQALETAKLDSEDAVSARKDHDRSLNLNDKRLADYEERPTGRTIRGKPELKKGAKLLELEGISLNKQNAQSRFDAAKANLATAQGEVRKFQNELDGRDSSGLTVVSTRDRTVVLRDLTAAKDVEARLNAETTRLETQVNSYGEREVELQTEQETLIARKKELDTEKRVLDRKVGETKNTLQKRQQALADAQQLQVSQEQGIVDGFGNVFKDATTELLGQQVDDALKAYDAELEVRKGQATNNNEKALYDAMQKYPLGSERTRKKGLLGFRKEVKYRPMSTEKVSQLHDALIMNGPLESAVTLLTSQDNPAAGVRGVKYTEAEARAILADKTFADKMLPIVTEQILRRKMLVGGMSQEDIDIIVNAPWGKDALKNAAQKNADVRAAIETDMGPGAFDAPNFQEKLAEQIKKHPWWLLLLLGAPFLVGGAIGAKSLENIGK